MTYVQIFEETDRSTQTHQSILLLLVWVAKIYTNSPLIYQDSHFENIAYNTKLLQTDQSLLMIFGMNQQNTDF